MIRDKEYFDNLRQRLVLRQKLLRSESPAYEILSACGLRKIYCPEIYIFVDWFWNQFGARSHKSNTTDDMVNMFHSCLLLVDPEISKERIKAYLEEALESQSWD